jgi:hypothetical protein
MNTPATPPGANCEQDVSYTHTQELLANLPYLLMLLLGGAILALTTSSIWSLVAAIGFVTYGLAGSIWIMAFVCPYCHFFNTRRCPCGYGQFAPRFATPRDGSRFSEKFRRHIPVIVPLWLIPPAAAIGSLIHSYSTALLLLLLAFGLNSFVILPLLSRRHCCSSCPQKDGCPWMGKR